MNFAYLIWGTYCGLYFNLFRFLSIERVNQKVHWLDDSTSQFEEKRRFVIINPFFILNICHCSRVPKTCFFISSIRHENFAMSFHDTSN